MGPAHLALLPAAYLGEPDWVGIVAEAVPPGDDGEWVRRVLAAGIRTVQLRIKDPQEPTLAVQMAEAILDTARATGYQHVLLDTLSDMEAARALYVDLGFVEIPPYYHNPIAGAHYLMVRI